MGVEMTVNGAAAVVTMSWTDRRNALGPQDACAIAEALTEAGRQDVAAIVLTGDGAFCAGGDLPTFAEISASRTVDDIRRHVYRDVQSVIRALRAAPLPTIAAVDGAAVGLGMDLALACDSRFVGPRGWMMQGWARAGLITGTGGVGFLEWLRPGVLWKLIAEQPRLDGPYCEQLAIGEVGSPTAMDAALARANQLADTDREVLEAYVVLDRENRWPPAEHFYMCADYQARFIGSQRFRELSAELLESTTRAWTSR